MRSLCARRPVSTGWLSVLVSILLTFGVVFGSAVPMAHADGVQPAAGVVAGSIAGSVTVPSGTEWVSVNVYRVVAGDEEFVASGSTAGSGDFTIPSLSPGSYLVRFQSSAYRDACFGGNPCAPVIVTEGATTQLGLVSLVLRDPGSLTGLVRDTSNAPIVGATVTATRNATVISGSTDSTGRFTITGLASGVGWAVEVTHPGYAARSDYYEVSENRTYDAGTLRIFRPGSITGRVTGDGGVALAGVSLALDPTEYGATRYAISDQSGNYTFTELPPGRYWLRAEGTGTYLSGYAPAGGDRGDATSIPLLESGSRTQDISLVHSASISGLVKDSNGTPSVGYAYLYDESDDWNTSVSLDAGSYRFTWLRPGRYTVRIEINGDDTWLGGSASIDDATWVTLSSGQASVGNDIVAGAASTATVSGAIVDSNGNPVQAELRLVGDPNWIYTTSGLDGHFTTKAHPGTYGVRVERGGTTICGPGFTKACSVPSVDAAAGQVTTVNVKLPVTGSVSGKVTGPGGAVLTWGHITLDDSNGRTVGEFELSDELPDYLIDNVPFGTYAMTVSGSKLLDAHRTVVVDGTTTSDVELSAGHSISGTVTITADESSEDGYVVVEIADAATGERVGRRGIGDITAGAHTFSLGRLPDGQYVVGIEASEQRWRWYPDATELVNATKITVAGANVKGINLTLPALEPRVVVSGQLTLPPGVTAPEYYPEIEFENLATGDDYWTDAQDAGTYTIGLPVGDYEVTVESSRTLGTSGAVEQLTVAGPMTHDIALAAGGTLVGRLVDADGIGVTGYVSVTVDGRFADEATTDDWGYWELKTLPAGTAVLRVEPEADDMGAAATFPGITVVAGKVFDTGQQLIVPVGWVRVRVPQVGNGDEALTVAVTDSDGHVLATDRFYESDTDSIAVRAGTVKVRFSGPAIKTEWWQDADTVTAAKTLTVAAGRTTATIAPTLNPADPAQKGTLSGSITNATGKVGTLGVSVFAADGDARSVPVAADGSYSVKLEPGDYTVRGSLCTGYWMGLSGCMGQQTLTWFGGTNRATAAVITIGSGRTTSGIDMAVGGKPTYVASPKPVIDGAAVFGATLTAATGTWTPEPDSFTYQWLRNGVAIDGATGHAYILGADDLGKTVTVTVTATRLGYAPVTRTSEPTAPVDVADLTPGTPLITGTAVVGATVTAATGTWAPDGVAFAYQWKRNGTPVDGATTGTYLVGPADAGTKLSVTVSGSKPGYRGAERTSAETATVPGLAYTGAPTPTITGTAKVGSTLTAKAGTWVPAPDTLKYSWKRSGVVINGASLPGYTLVGADLGKTISVTVTATRVGYTETTRTSKATSKVTSGKLSSALPTISGKPQVGETLTAEPGTWAPAGVTFAYKWYRSGKAIKHAASKSYVLTSADLKKKITVTVIGSATGYATASRTSKATPKVIAGALTVGTATITGTPQVGLPLTAVPAGWAPAPVGFTYQWYRTGKAIPKATKSTYTPTASDLAAKITVKVTGGKAGYTPASVTSVATDAVAVGTLVVGTPTISGTPKIGKTLTAKPGTWGPGTVSFSYQWLRNGTAIAKATKSTYTATSGDAASTITVKVTGTKSGFTSATAESAGVAIS